MQTLDSGDGKAEAAKELHSLMKLELGREYATEAGNSLVRKGLQRAVLAGRIELPVSASASASACASAAASAGRVGEDASHSQQAWAWMLRGLVPRAEGSSVHVLCTLRTELSGQQAAEPCLIMFVRGKDVNPASLKRL